MYNKAFKASNIIIEYVCYMAQKEGSDDKGYDKRVAF